MHSQQHKYKSGYLYTKVKVKAAMPQLGRRRGAHLPLAAVEPVGG